MATSEETFGLSFCSCVFSHLSLSETATLLRPKKRPGSFMMDEQSLKFFKFFYPILILKSSLVFWHKSKAVKVFEVKICGKTFLSTGSKLQSSY